MVGIDPRPQHLGIVVDPPQLSTAPGVCVPRSNPIKQ